MHADTPFRHVCCCIDDARHAGPAIAEAHRIVGGTGRVSVVHVAPGRRVARGALTESGEVDPDGPLGTAHDWLTETAAAAGGGEPVLLTGEPPAVAALGWIRRSHVDLIVCSARSGGLRHQVLGSFAARMATDAPCPVLLLPPSPDGAWPPAPAVGPYRNVAALVDDSGRSLQALDALPFVTADDAHVTTVALRNPVGRALEALGLTSLTGAAGDPEVRAIGDGQPVRLRGRQGRAFDAWARGAGIDLAVVAGSWLGPMLFARIGRLVADGTCSVLVVRGRLPGEPAGAAGP